MAFNKGKGVGTLARMNGKDRERERGKEREGRGEGGENLYWLRSIITSAPLCTHVNVS